MPRYERIWLEEAQKQYHSFPDAIRRLIDCRIKELLEDPTGDSHRRYYERHDEWSIPFAFGDDEGFIYYAVVDKPRRVVILRRLVFGG
jgi:mRNA-degrading endonuclease RelE of RelBE toxin-antitoxin system